MTMLEDDLREMFGARVSKSPSPEDPAGVAIGRGRKAATRRRTAIGAFAIIACVAMLGGIVSLKNIFSSSEPTGDDITYDALYRSGTQNQGYASESLPIIPMPVDVHVGRQLWTSDGVRHTLTGVQEVIHVVRVPAGWIYSDDFRLRLLTVAGKMIPLRDGISSWAVSHDGLEVASVSEETNLEIHPAGGSPGTATVVPKGTRAVDFDAGRVVLSRDGAGSDHWSGEPSSYQEAWHDQLLVVYGAGTDDAVGLLRRADTTCLVELRAQESGWHVGSTLGCGDLLETAAAARYGISRAARSPDGRWLAVPSPTGVHVIDIHGSRDAAAKAEVGGGPPVVAYSCMSRPDAPAVWSDAKTMLTISTGNGVIACATDGSRYAVQLPPGISDGWELVRRFGVIG